MQWPKIFPSPQSWLKALILCLLFAASTVVIFPVAMLWSGLVASEWLLLGGVWFTFSLPGLGMGLLSWVLRRWPKTRAKLGFRRRPWSEAAIGAGIMLLVSGIGFVFGVESLAGILLTWALMLYCYHLDLLL